MRCAARKSRCGAGTKRVSAGRAPRDTGCEWTRIFGARRLSRTRRDRRAGHAIRKHRSHDLAEISKTVAEGAHAILAPDGAGRHGARALRVPDNITLLPLPPHTPQINPVENVRACLRANNPAISVFNSYHDIVDRRCKAWNVFANNPATVRSITTRDYANRINI